jgi:hypothetical protein
MTYFLINQALHFVDLPFDLVLGTGLHCADPSALISILVQHGGFADLPDKAP